MRRMANGWRRLACLVVAVLGAAGCSQERASSNPRERPSAILADFETENPLVTSGGRVEPSSGTT